MQAAGLRYLQFADLARAGLVNSRETLRRWMNEGRFPKPIYPENQSPRWLVSELLEWERALLEQRNAA
jgi:predicted DNA-binding transcriptional regulator AlpA